MGQFALGAALLAAAAILGFFGQQLMRENWGFWQKTEVRAGVGEVTGVVEKDSSIGANNSQTNSIVSDFEYNEQSDWWQKVHQPDDLPFRETEIRILDEQSKLLVGARYFEVLNECAWVEKSASKFEFENGAKCRLETLLGKRKFQERLLWARHLVFAGMESYNNAPTQSVENCDHDWLSECRANELAERTRNQTPQEWPKETSFWVLDLGFSNQKNDSLEFDQRRAIIIGVRERDSSISVDAALSMIVARANIGVINLGHYSNFSNLNLEEVAWVEADGSSSKHE